MSHKLTKKEIFAVGKWNGFDFTEGDLEDIEANFNALAGVHHVPLKLGHNEEQKVTDGQPALGWVSRVYKEGMKLFADFTDLPTVIFNAIKENLYRTVSVELLFGVDYKGKKYNHVLDAVALLGADHPAVNTLEDLNLLLASRATFSSGHRVTFETITGSKTPETEDDEMAMDEKAVERMLAKALAPIQSANEDLQSENKKLRDAAVKRDEDDARFAREQKAEKVRTARSEVNVVLDKAVTDKQMTPALRESYSRQIGVDKDDRVLDIDIEQVKLMCGAVKGSNESGDSGRTDDGKRATDLENPEEALIRMTHKHQLDTGEKSFRAAFSRVAQSDPELHKAYLDQNGVKQ